MTHSIAAQAVIDAAPLVKLGTCDVLGTMEQAALLAAGQVSLMSTKTGLSTILVDRNHDFAGHVGLSEMVRSPIGPDILLSGGESAASAAQRAVRPGVAAVAAVVILGSAGTWYLVHKRRKDKAAPEDIQPAVQPVLAEAEAVVDAELARLSQTTHGPSQSQAQAAPIQPAGPGASGLSGAAEMLRA